MSVNVKSVSKEIASLEKKLDQQKKILALLSGTKRKPSSGTKAKAKAKAAPKAERAAKRRLTDEHLEIVAKAIGDQLPAIELKGKIDGRVLRGLPLKQAIAKLRKSGRLTSLGEKRQLVYVKVVPATPPAPVESSTEPVAEA